MNKNKGININLKNGRPGYSIKLKNEKMRIGGFYTEEGKIVTFWDQRMKKNEDIEKLKNLNGMNFEKFYVRDKIIY